MFHKTIAAIAFLLMTACAGQHYTCKEAAGDARASCRELSHGDRAAFNTCMRRRAADMCIE